MKKAKQEIVHCWIGKDPIFKPDKFNPTYCADHPETCVHTARAGEYAHLTYHISMIPYYERQKAKAGIKTIWHDHKPHWVK